MIAQTFSPICRPIIKINGSKATAAPPDSTDRQVSEAENAAQTFQRHIELDAEVSLESESNFYRGFSEAGLFFTTWSPLPSGTSILLKLSLPASKDRFQVEGVVKFVRDFNPRTPELTPGMAIEFQKLQGKTKKAIDAFARLREPLFYD